MTPLNRAIAYPLVAAAALGLLAASPGAAALYIVTPLHLTASTTEVDVGDKLSFDVSPAGEEYDGPTYGGETVRVRYGFDPREGEEREPSSNGTENGTVSSDEAPAEEPVDPYTYGDVATITLSEKSTASFEWTIPAEVDDHNVAIQILAENGDLLATTHVAVGDAVPMMYLAMTGEPEGAPDAPADGGEPAPAATPPAPTGAAGDARDAESGRSVPGLGAIGVAVAALAAAAMVVANRRT